MGDGGRTDMKDFKKDVIFRKQDRRVKWIQGLNMATR